MQQTQRLLGIDLCRGLAAFAVILVHSGDKTWGLPVDPWANNFRLLFYFAVPFFLAVSFLFMTRKPNLAYSSDFWRSRFERIVLPYAIWSVIYLLFRVAFFWASNRLDRVSKLTQDPIAIIFFGWSSYQLYFLPLLLVGTCLILCSGYFYRRQFANWQLLLLAAIFVAINHLIFISGNGFQLRHGIAFASLFQLIDIDIKDLGIVRILLVYLIWLFKCLPYFLISIVLNRLLVKQDFQILAQQYFPAIALVLVIIGNLIAVFWLPKSLGELIKAYSLLVFGIAISRNLGKDNWLINNLGRCSFGIYLIHPLVMNFVKIFLEKAYPLTTLEVTISTVLAISILSFVVSWFTVYLMSKNKQVAKYLFGV
ncbi:MAG: acyltransferase [Cyanobacteria bacterium P01_G01_bin.19]